MSFTFIINYLVSREHELHEVLNVLLRLLGGARRLKTNLRNILNWFNWDSNPGATQVTAKALSYRVGFSVSTFLFTYL